MTRINCVPVTELSRKHLIAEYRELPRIFTGVQHAIKRGKKAKQYKDEFTFYVLGPGHVRFFYPRLTYLLRRHMLLVSEMLARGYNPQFLSLSHKLEGITAEWMGDWEPNEFDLELNRIRIKERGG